MAFACASRFHPEVRASGFTCFAAGADYLLAEVSKFFPEVGPPGPARGPKMRALWRGPLAVQMARDLIAVAETFAPDVLVHEGVEFGAALAAEHLGIAHAAAGPLWFRADSVAPLEAAVSEMGLAPERVHQFRDLALAVMPPSWIADDDVLPETVHFIRPETHQSAAALPWLDALPSDRPLVHATMGTTEVNRTPGLYEAILAGLRDEPISLVVATGQERDPSEFGPQPANVRLERYIPHAALLPRCRLVVTHGGHGTLMASFALGIPVVVLPVNADQPRNGAQCEALGAGRSIPAPQRTPEAIRAAVREVLAEPSYVRGAETLRDALATLPGLDEAIALIEKL